MRCYNDQLTNLLRLCEGFAEKLVAHLSALFNRLVIATIRLWLYDLNLKLNLRQN